VEAVHVGRVADLPFSGGVVRSAFAKRAVTGPIGVAVGGLDGDEQGDRRHHGGPDKAICVYPAEHYPWFSSCLGRPAPRPALGENLTVRGAVEDDVCVGDRWRIDAVVAEVSLPRNPCFKVGARHRVRDAVRWMERTGRTGYYLRVLEPGALATGAVIELLERPHPAATIAEANRVMHHDPLDRAALTALLAAPALGDSWRRTFERRLADGVVEDATGRRLGPAPNQDGI